MNPLDEVMTLREAVHMIVEWAKERGHYPLVNLMNNFVNYNEMKSAKRLDEVVKEQEK